jgi:hypothetical protein
MDVSPHGSTLDEFREELQAIRTSLLARTERRFRGLTASERALLESSTAHLVDDVLRLLERKAHLIPPAGR